jgi:carbamoyltransferase
MSGTPAVVVGLNCSHDAAAAVAVDGVLVAAISEERLNGVKHYKGFPRRALDYCLQSAGLDHASVNVSALVVNQLPLTNFDVEAVKFFGRDRVQRVIVNPSHHYLHACYAEMLTHERPLVILVADGSGYSYAEHRRQGSPLLGPEPQHVDMWESLSAYLVGADGQMTLLLKDWGCWRDTRFPSLGHMCGDAAERVFGSWIHAGKLMGLAPFGDPAALGSAPVVTLRSDGLDVSTEWLEEVPRIANVGNPETIPLARNIAAKAQAELEKGMLHVCAMLAEKTSCRTICLTGGVALNSTFNGRLVREGLFENVVVSPASSDAGTAIGATAYGCKEVGGMPLRVEKDIEFLGRVYGEAEVAQALETVSSSVRVSRCRDSARTAADELAEGRILGWFEGASEFGPRALGHRSIFADPRIVGMKDRLNSRVKFRESFRPYAAAVLEEHCADWFDMRIHSPHMLMVANVRPEKRALIPAVVHVDGSCRLQTVAPRSPGGLRPLLEAFFNRTRVPLVLNTSLNIHGRPVAETPADAVACLLNSGLEVLYCEGYRVEKETAPLTEDEISELVVAPTAEFLLAGYRNAQVRSGMFQWSIWQGGRRTLITMDEKDVLVSLTRRKTTREIADDVPGTGVEQVFACVRSLCDRGVLKLERQPDLEPVAPQAR